MKRLNLVAMFKHWVKWKVAGKELNKLWRLQQRINELESWLSVEPKVVEVARWLKEDERPLGIEQFRSVFETQFGCRRYMGEKATALFNHRTVNGRPADEDVVLDPLGKEALLIQRVRELEYWCSDFPELSEAAGWLLEGIDHDSLGYHGPAGDVAEFRQYLRDKYQGKHMDDVPSNVDLKQSLKGRGYNEQVTTIDDKPYIKFQTAFEDKK